MSETPPPGDAPPPEAEPGFSPVRTLTAIGISILINAVLPYLIYVALEPRFPAGSLTPLLASTVFPFLALTIGLAVRRTVDIVAIIALVEISGNLLVTLVASNVQWALVARAAQSSLTGLFFLATILIGRPLLYYVARQFVAANSPAIVERFQQANRRDGGRTFIRLTAVWGAGNILTSAVTVWLALNASPETYLLVAPVIGISVTVAMITFTIRYASTRLRKAGETAGA